MSQHVDYPDTAKLRQTIQSAERQINQLRIEQAQADSHRRSYYEAEIATIEDRIQPVRDAYDAALDELVRSACH